MTTNEVQPWLNQIELKFDKPLIKDSYVDSYRDLIFLNPIYNYLHKQIWVREHKCIYYLSYGDGTELDNWKKTTARVVIEKFDVTLDYQKDDTVFLQGKLYKASKDVPKGYSPINYSEYWYCISGETETYTRVFVKQDTVRVYTEIRNPKFEVIIGDVEFDHLGNPVTDNNGDVIFKNKEIIKPYVKILENATPDNGIPYDIMFFENSLPVKLNGIINIK